MTEYVRVPRDGPDIIWLEPSCCADPSHGRQWCEDDAFPVCEDGHEPVKYIRADLAASPQEAVPTKREAALADLAKLDGETMDLAASPQGEADWITHDGGPNPVPGKMVSARYRHGCTTSSTVGASEAVWWDAAIAYRVTEGVNP